MDADCWGSCRMQASTRRWTVPTRRMSGVMLLVAAASLGSGAAGTPASSLALQSPDGTLTLVLARTAAGGWTHALNIGRDVVLEPSALGIVVDGRNLADGADVRGVERYQMDERYPWRGVHATAVNRCRGARLALTHLATRTAWTIDARACDDGIAFRYLVPGDAPDGRTPDEATTFRWAAGTTVWYHDFEGHYEGVHTRQDISDVPVGGWAAPPLTVQLPGGAGYASVTEAALVGYSGMALRADGERGFRARLGHDEPVSYPYRLRYPVEEAQRLARAAVITGPITSPWRVVIAGRTLDALVNADLVH
ncbi:MAG: glycoside hydrolase family 97 N-terminal domain-containing protein, partial [Acidobacteria bacterium]|nr:glycoside hydrolase family 97 N-terminal domain-containing protein [Acidobacteriota bacterium]